MGADVLVIAVAVALILVVMRLSWMRHMRGGDDADREEEAAEVEMPEEVVRDQAGGAGYGDDGRRPLPGTAELCVQVPELQRVASDEEAADEEWAERLHDINAELGPASIIQPRIGLGFQREMDEQGNVLSWEATYGGKPVSRQEAEYERHLTWLDHHPACILQDLPEDVYDRCVNLGNDAYWRLRQGWLEAGQVRHAAERARFLAAAAADVELVDRWMGDGMPWTRYVPAAPAWIAA